MESQVTARLSYQRRTRQLVAVIIPCYNHAHFLGKAIESVLAQTYPHVEILVVDDGSTDQTASVAGQYPDVYYIHQKNQGLAAARNTGIRESSADFLVFLDADDRLLPNAVEVGLQHLAAHPECAFVSGHYSFIARDGSLQSTTQQQRVQQDHYRALLQGNYIGMHATVLYRRAALLSVGGFNPALAACEDYDLYLRITRTFPVYCHDQIVAEYRQHGANMSRNTGLMLMTAQAVLHSQAKYITAIPYIEAYQRGLASWQNYYGEALCNQTVQYWKSGRYMLAINGIILLLQNAPLYIVEQIYQPLKWSVLMKLHSLLPVSVLHFLARWKKTAYTPPVGKLQFGDLRRTEPISREFGYDRGLPIDRYYIDKFLARHSHDIHGHALEIGDREYTNKYGGHRVETSDVLHVNRGNPLATVVADLTCAEHIPDNKYDCIILTQTLHLIYDVQSALRTIYRILKPGGTLLATVPGITPISNDEWATSWYWAFTILSIQRILGETFLAHNVQVEAHGNVLAATAFLQGIATEELHQTELDHYDRQYQLLITVRAQKPTIDKAVSRVRSGSSGMGTAVDSSPTLR